MEAARRFGGEFSGVEFSGVVVKLRGVVVTAV
jgi:hypothetical protein